jgi:mRNA interferase MazF
MFDAGDIVLLPFPFSDLTSAKRRPVLMLTAPDAQGDFLACPVTSRAGWVHARGLPAEDLAEGTLPMVSWVRTDKVVTLHIGLVVRRFDCVTAAFRTAVASDICRYIGPAADMLPG